VLLLIYSLALLVAVLSSDRFNRTILSSAVLFLLLGFCVGPAVLDITSRGAGDEIVLRLSDWALVAILFTDALRIGWGDLKHTWRLPGRALLLGLPLTLIGIAAVGHWLMRLRWMEALLVGAILSPTDPVFAAAIVGREEIPARLRQLLNVESGLNDGLALPFVILLMGAAGGQESGVSWVVREALEGAALGALVGLVAGSVRRLSVFGVTEAAAPLHAFAALLITYSAAEVFHLNAYLAAFSAGVAFATACSEAAEEFHAFGEQIAELLKLAAVFLFAVMLSTHMPVLPWIDYIFAAVVLTLVRFVAIELALIRSALTAPERLTAAWFGPKGFASVVYAMMLLNSAVPRRHMLFEIIAVVIAASIVLHSSTDVPVARYFSRSSARPRSVSGEL
jgi:NhaP-type Na+/H+ or K+/H+ antiporter